MSYALKELSVNIKQPEKLHIRFINELKFTVQLPKSPGKVSILVLKNIYITKLYCLIYLA